MNEHAQIEQGRRAREVLENPAFQAAWKAYEDKILEQFTKANPWDADMLRTLKHQHVALKVVRANLEALIADGIEAAEKIKYERSTQDRLRRLVN